MSDVIKQAIEHAQSQGWSIIPLKGYGEDAKRPAPSLGSWSQYQQTAAIQSEIKHWIASGMTAYGVIMGKCSDNIIAIDFDILGIYQQFCIKFPRISQSYTVKTRKGYHLYLKSPQKVTTTRFSGGDIIGEGSYVVGAGSIIRNLHEGKLSKTQYTIENDTNIQPITQQQWQAISRDLKITHAQNDKQTIEPQITVHTLQAQYNKKAPQSGRNNTLYSLSRQANNSGINIEQTIQTLAEHHASAQAPQSHIRETIEQREKEAIRTIHSAYKTQGANALKPDRDTRETKGQLPNNLREALLRETARLNEKDEYVGASAIQVRLIEALNKKGYLGTITSKAIIQQVANKYKLSRKSINILLSDNKSQLEITTVVSHSDNDKSPVREGEGKNTIEEFYRIPSLDSLLQHFELVPQAVDILSDEDLYSNKKYLQAMHREFIKRNGGYTSTIFCANRLSITSRTLLNYDNDLNIIKTDVVQYVRIGWHNVDEDIFANADSKGITPGAWLQNSDGKRYPALKGIALTLLKDGKKFILCKQKASRRYVPNPVMVFHEVWWLASDGSEWGGGAYDFPPQAITHNKPETVSAINLEPLTEQPSSNDVDDAIATYHRLQFEERDRKRLDAILEQVQQARQTQTFVVDPHINASLQLIKGIGERIREQLELAGIAFMTDLISVGAESVTTIFYYNSYISSRTTQAWINQAELLLGLRTQTANERHQDRLQIQQLALKHYKAAYRTLQGFIRELLITDEQDNLALLRFEERLDIWLEHPYIFKSFKFTEVQSRVITELEDYLTYLHGFIDRGDDWLERWSMPSTRYWQTRILNVKKQLAVWQNLSLG